MFENMFSNIFTYMKTIFLVTKYLKKYYSISIRLKETLLLVFK